MGEDLTVPRRGSPQACRSSGPRWTTSSGMQRRLCRRPSIGALALVLHPAFHPSPENPLVAHNRKLVIWMPYSMSWTPQTINDWIHSAPPHPERSDAEQSHPMSVVEDQQDMEVGRGPGMVEGDMRVGRRSIISVRLLAHYQCRHKLGCTEKMFGRRIFTRRSSGTRGIIPLINPVLVRQ